MNTVVFARRAGGRPQHRLVRIRAQFAARAPPASPRPRRPARRGRRGRGRRARPARAGRRTAHRRRRRPCRAPSTSPESLKPAFTADGGEHGFRSSLAALADADGLVHATPTGMAAHPGLPLPDELLRPDLWVAEVVYRPLETELLRAARRGLPHARRRRHGRLPGRGRLRLFTGVSRTPTGCSPTSPTSSAARRRSMTDAHEQARHRHRLPVRHARRQARRRRRGRLRRRRDLRERPDRAAPLVARPRSAPAAPTSACPSTSTSRSATSRRVPPDRLRRATCAARERKFDVMAELGADTVLVCSSVAPDASTTTTSPPSSCTCSPSGPAHAACASPTRRSPGAGTSPPRTTRGASSSAPTTRRSACAWTASTSSPAARPAGHRGRSPAKVFFLQLADAPRLAMDVLQWSRHHRLFPRPGRPSTSPASLGHVAATRATPGRSRSRSSTTSSARPTRTAPRSTRCGR